MKRAIFVAIVLAAATSFALPAFARHNKERDKSYPEPSSVFATRIENRIAALQRRRDSKLQSHSLSTAKAAKLTARFADLSARIHSRLTKVSADSKISSHEAKGIRARVRHLENAIKNN